MYEYQLQGRNGQHHKGHIIKVIGEGEIAVQPDTASINLGVITESKELVAAQQQNSQVTAKVIDSLLALGLTKSMLQTFDYRIESDYDYHEGQQIFRGYKITHILQVKIEDLNLVGKVVDTAVQNGANYVSNVQFKVKDDDAYYRQALSTAVMNAIEKAKAIAGTLKVTLIPTPTNVIESGNTIEPFFHQPQTLVKGISSTQIEPGQLIVKASVTAEFRFY